MFVTGIKPAEVYTSDDRAQGKGYQPGTRGTDGSGKEYTYCLVAASQNLVAGNVVTIGNGYSATILATGAPAPGASGAVLAVVVASVTASASNYIWCQVYGSGSVLVSEVTASNLPNHILVPSSHSGIVKGGIATASSYIAGMVLTATASVTGLAACMLTYPRLAPA